MIGIAFVLENDFEFYSFLSSWQWWELQSLLWKKIFRFWIYNEKNKLIGLLPFIKNTAKRWTYLFAPHTPLIIKNLDFFNIIEYIINDLKIFK